MLANMNEVYFWRESVKFRTRLIISLFALVGELLGILKVFCCPEAGCPFHVLLCLGSGVLGYSCLSQSWAFP